VSLRSLLSQLVHVEEAVDVDREVALRPDEAHFVADAVDTRRREFAVGRSLAREALRSIGASAGPIGVGAHREPLWPAGVVGSITHCDGYIAAAVAFRDDVRSLGVDAEPALPLPADVVALVASPDEFARLDGIGPAAERVLFSAKESIYKAWFPLTGRWLGFEDCDLSLTPSDTAAGSFVGNVRPSLLIDEHDVDAFHGRYEIHGGHILTAVVVPNDRSAPRCD
jgi:4'-phosphopantetheinyl transferase EntD